MPSPVQTPLPTRQVPPVRALKVERIAPGFAAIDIGSEQLFVAVAHVPVRSFGTFTSDVRALCAYLQDAGVSQVAMEATGVYSDAAL